jgi:hypothetical protein
MTEKPGEQKPEDLLKQYQDRIAALEKAVGIVRKPVEVQGKQKEPSYTRKRH